MDAGSRRILMDALKYAARGVNDEYDRRFLYKAAHELVDLSSDRMDLYLAFPLLMKGRTDISRRLMDAILETALI